MFVEKNGERKFLKAEAKERNRKKRAQGLSERGEDGGWHGRKPENCWLL